MSDRIVAKIVEWMKTQPVWLQEAFHSIQYGNEPEITRLAQLCMLQARGRTSGTSLTAAPGESDMSTSEDVRLLALSDVKGINRLASGATLEFETARGSATIHAKENSKLDGEAVPIEVKSRTDRKCAAFKSFVNNRHPRYAIRFSALNLKRDGAFVNIPLYLVPRFSACL